VIYNNALENTRKIQFVREIYDSAKRLHPSLEELKNLYKYRDLIVQLVRRDLVSRYKRSVLGMLWTMLNPLGTMLIMTVVFSQVFNRVEYYPVYILTGIISWNFFAQTTRHCMDSMLWGSNLFSRIYMPRSSFILSSIGTGVVNYFISLVPLFLIMLITGIPLRWTALLLPLVLLPLILFSLGIGLLLSAYAVYFPDIAEMYSILLIAWMYLSPVIVPQEVLENVLNGWVLKLNPLYYFIANIRDVLYSGTLPSLQHMAAAILVSIVFLLVGWLIFTIKSDEFAYYV